jgi:ribosomal protein L37AE/L43A
VNKSNYYDMMLDGMANELIGSVKSSKVKRHQETCPICGKKLVNLYFDTNHRVWQCKKCMDMFAKIKMLNKEAAHEHRNDEERNTESL